MQWCSWFLTGKDEEVSRTDTSPYRVPWFSEYSDKVQKILSCAAWVSLRQKIYLDDSALKVHEDFSQRWDGLRLVSEKRVNVTLSSAGQ